MSGSSGNATTNTGTDITGFIPVTNGDSVYLKNVTMPDTNENYYAFVGHYNSNQEYITGYYFYSGMNTDNADKLTYDTDGNLTHFIVGYHKGLAYIRICAKNIDDTSIITVNESIE